MNAACAFLADVLQEPRRRAVNQRLREFHAKRIKAKNDRSAFFKILIFTLTLPPPLDILPFWLTREAAKNVQPSTGGVEYVAYGHF